MAKQIRNLGIILALIYDPDYHEYENDYISDNLNLEGDERELVVDKIQEIKDQYEVVETDLEADGDEHYFNMLSNVKIVRHKETGKFYKLDWTHDSWSDSSLSDSNPSMVEVQKVTKTVDTYE